MMIGSRRIAFPRRALPFLLALAALAGCAGQPAPALNAGDRDRLAQVQSYLDGLRGFHSGFTQSGTDGGAAGVLWVDRPDRLRVEYQAPHPKLLLANHGRLLLADLVTHATTTMPVSRTPLGILLADRLDLAGPAVTVTSLQQQPGALQMSLIKAGAPGQGRLTLQFTTSPLALTGVVVQDAQGHTNTLQLAGLVRDSAIDQSLFHYRPAAAPAE
jgi:outer membrane lipoprotein-sorting protein